MLEETKLLVPTQEEELLLYPMTSLSTDAAFKSERISTQMSKYLC